MKHKVKVTVIDKKSITTIKLALFLYSSYP